MKKVKLDPDSVLVESFETGTGDGSAGTVLAHETGISRCALCNPGDSYPNCPEPSAGGSCAATCEYTCDANALTCMAGCTSPQFGCV